MEIGGSRSKVPLRIRHQRPERGCAVRAEGKQAPGALCAVRILQHTVNMLDDDIGYETLVEDFNAYSATA